MEIWHARGGHHFRESRRRAPLRLPKSASNIFVVKLRRMAKAAMSTWVGTLQPDARPNRLPGGNVAADSDQRPMETVCGIGRKPGEEITRASGPNRRPKCSNLDFLVRPRLCASGSPLSGAWALDWCTIGLPVPTVVLFAVRLNAHIHTRTQELCWGVLGQRSADAQPLLGQSWANPRSVRGKSMLGQPHWPTTRPDLDGH